MAFMDEFQQFVTFVRENNVENRKEPVLYDLEDQTYVAHVSRLPNPHYEPIFTVDIHIDGEWYRLLRKIGGFRPEVVEN